MSIVSVPLDFRSVYSLFDIKVACISYVLYTHLWAVYTKFGITKNGTCDIILYLNTSIQLRIEAFSLAMQINKKN